MAGCLALVLGWACGGEDNEDTSASCTQGAEKCGCYRNGTCDGSLRCLSNVCVAVNSPSGNAGSGAADDGGENGFDAGGSESGGRAPTSTGGSVGSGGALGTGGRSANGASGGSEEANGGDVGAHSGSGGAPPTTGDAGDGGVLETGGGAGGIESGTGGASLPGGGSAQGGEPGAGGELLFSDDFEDGNVSGWIAPSWMLFSDGNDRVIRQDPTYSGATTPATVEGPDWGDRRMEISFKFTQTSSLSFAVLGTEFQSSDDRDQLMIDTSGAGTLLHASGGQNTTKTFTRSVTTGTWYRLALEIEGTTLRGYFDGVLVAELTNVSGIGGGLAITGLKTGDIYYDDVLVTTLP